MGIRARAGLALAGGVALLILAVWVEGCGGSTGGGPAPASTTASAVQVASSVPLLPAPTRGEVLPLVLVHGINGDTNDWDQVVAGLARGRTVRRIYAGDSDHLPTGGLPRDSLFQVGYYRERVGSPYGYTDRAPQLPSIGGCPVPRTDPVAPAYAISYAAQLDRAVENVCRATGAERIDLVCFSMGGVVGRAYTRWLSLKATGGRSRVRRLLTIASPNHGINSLEATSLAYASATSRPCVGQGEAAELDRECSYWSGRSYIDLLNDGWDAFTQTRGVTYAGAYGHGHSIQHQPLVRSAIPPVSWVLGWITPALLAHPNPNFDLARELAEAAEDGDGTVRASSAIFDPASFPHARFAAPYYGCHALTGADPDLTLRDSVWNEALVRRFALEGRAGLGFAASGSVALVDRPGEASWLEVEVDVSAGTPLAAQVSVFVPARNASHAYGLLLHPGHQRLFLDPVGSEGAAEVQLRLYGLDREVVGPPVTCLIRRRGLAAPRRPLARIEDVRTGASGLTARAVRGAGQELAWALDAGAGAVWSPFRPESEVRLPALTPGTYELRLRVRGPVGTSGRVAEATRPDAVLLRVDASGALSVTR